MRLRTLTIWHKFKKLWLTLLGWLVLSVLMIAVLAWSVVDQNGGLGRIQPAYQTEIKGEDAERLEIQASGVRLEIAGSVDANKVRAYLYGPGYAGQEVRLYQRGDTIYAHLAQDPPIAGNFGYDGVEELTMRVIVPKRSYEAIAVEAERAQVRLTNLRSDFLTLDLTDGSAQLDRLDLKQAQAVSGSAQIAIKDVSINDLTLTNQSGDTTVSRSQLRHWHYDGGSGDLLVEQKNVKGVWQLETASGDIHVQTTRTPYDLLCQLESIRGSVAVEYEKYGWDELLAERLEEKNVQGCIGEGRQMLLVKTDKGNITVGKP